MAMSTPTANILSSRFPSVAIALKKSAETLPALQVNPELATMWAQMQAKAPRPNVLYVVSGFGEQVRALLPRVDASACVLVYEASLPRLRATLEADEWAPILGDERLHLFAGPCSASEFERLHNLPAARLTEVTVARFSPAWQLDEKSYAEFFGEFAGQFDVVRKLHLTNFNDSFFWQATTIQNIEGHCRAPDVGALSGMFPELPVVLVGAGPSLDEAGDFLKKIKNRAIIIAGNSSYRKLRNIGVRPHLVLAADPREGTARGFEGQPTDDGCFLVAPFIVNPKVVEMFAGNAFSWSGENNFFIHVLRKRLGLKEGTIILEKGTVSLSVADLAVLMGSRRLILVGQDMAIRTDGLTHATDSIYEGYQLPQVHMQTKKEAPTEGITRRVAGNTSDEVPTLDNLFVYLKAFEQWVEAHPQIEVLNTSRLGAKIAGARYVTYSEVAEKIPTASANIENRLREAFESAPERQTNPEEWLAAVQPTLTYARKLYETAFVGAVALETLPERYLQPAYREHKEVKETYARAEAINNLIEKNPDDYRILLEGRLKRALLDFQLQISTLDAPNSQAQELLRNREFFWALAEGIEPTLTVLEDKLPTKMAETTA